MSDEKAYIMTENIGKRVRCYIIFFVILILFLIWGDSIIALITQSISGGKDESELARKIIASVITGIGALALIFINLGRDINLHNFIDGAFFKVRKRTDQIIHERMIEAARAVGARGWQNMEAQPKEVGYLFYHFVNEQTVLRSLAFTYWEQYFVNIYVICFAFVGFVISSFIALAGWRFDFTVFSSFAFLVVLIGVGLSTRLSLIKKIYDLPNQQIEEIRSTKLTELKDEVEKRFGGITG
jgi:hypothetical protein